MNTVAKSPLRETANAGELNATGAVGEEAASPIPGKVAAVPGRELPL